MLKFQEWLSEAEIAELTQNYRGSRERCKITFQKWDRRRKTFEFRAEGRQLYRLQLRTDDYAQVSRLKGSALQRLRLALEGDVSLYCSCPSWRYNGYMYMADQLGYGIKPEEREPRVRNPKLQGTVCKHLLQLMEEVEDYEEEIQAEMQKTLDQERARRREAEEKKRLSR